MLLCLATNNAHKVEEMKQILGDDFELRTLAEIGCLDELPETQNTLEGNSLQKAQYVWEHFGVNCLADDSGLEVAALNNAPGVFSARYAGEPRSHERNMNKLLQNLIGITNRNAQFRAVITLILNGEAKQFEGLVSGKIIEEKRGTDGFGYDPIFVPDGYDTTFAEMSMEEKNPISHRGRSLDKMKEFLNSYRL